MCGAGDRHKGGGLIHESSKQETNWVGQRIARVGSLESDSHADRQIGECGGEVPEHPLGVVAEILPRDSAVVRKSPLSL